MKIEIYNKAFTTRETSSIYDTWVEKEISHVTVYFIYNRIFKCECTLCWDKKYLDDEVLFKAIVEKFTTNDA